METFSEEKDRGNKWLKKNQKQEQSRTYVSGCSKECIFRILFGTETSRAKNAKSIMSNTKVAVKPLSRETLDRIQKMADEEILRLLGIDQSKRKAILKKYEKES